MAWKLYTDSACTTELTGTLGLTHYADLSDNPQDRVLYYANIDEDTGDTQAIKKQEASNPGVNPITLSIVDAAVSSGHEASEITLATTAAALDTNTAGASLDLGPELLSGVSAAQPIHIRIVNAVTNVGSSTELSIEIVATVDLEV